MNLITINKSNIGNQEIQTVNARELHEFLESKRDFSNWIQERIATYGFIDGEDFTTNLLKTANGGRPRIDYYLSLDMAKELSMVERNEKGKQARQYFIECEKVVKKAMSALPNFNNPVEAARAWADQFEEKQIAYQKLEEQSQKIDLLESLFSEGMTVPAFCKRLNGVHVNQVNAFLKTKKWLNGDSQKGYRMAYFARDKYLTEQVAHEVQRSNGNKEIKYRQVLLRNGAVKLFDMYMKGELPMKKDWDGSYDHEKFLFSKEVA